MEPPTNTATLFTHPDADIVLRSSDGIDFRMFKCLLSLTSPFFKTMFTLPQTPDSNDQLPVIPIEENGRILAFLLGYCFPHETDIAIPETLEDYFSILGPARKYGMDGVERCIRRAVVSPKFHHENPLRVFILTLHHGFDDEAQIAARKTLSLPLMDRTYIPELEYITAGQLHFLQEYHIKCGAKASSITSDFAWITRESYIWFECGDCRRGQNPSLIRISNNRSVWVVSRWWTEYMREAGYALAESPSGRVVTTDLLNDALKKACICPGCRSKAFADLNEFSHLFSEEVDRVTSEVELTLKASGTSHESKPPSK